MEVYVAALYPARSSLPPCGFVGRCPDNRHLRHLVSIQTGMKGFSAYFPAVCTQKGAPLRLILQRSALKVFEAGKCVRLYDVLLRYAVI